MGRFLPLKINEEEGRDKGLLDGAGTGIASLGRPARCRPNCTNVQHYFLITCSTHFC